MRTVVVYESMYGNTHLIADAIAEGLRREAGQEVVVVPVADAATEVVGGVDLLVVGGPTHVHGLSRASTRHAAVEAAAKTGSGLSVEEDAEGPGLREWFDKVDTLPPLAAAFDTRMPGPPLFTGRASKGIAKRLRGHGSRLVLDPESFLVTRDNHLTDDELAHAHQWGSRLAGATASSSA